MSLGPVEFLVVSFPGNKFNGEIMPALAELVENGTIHVIDLIFARKDDDGSVTILEVNELDDDIVDAFGDIIDTDLGGFLSENDAIELAKMLETNSSAGLLLFENTWATRFRDAIVASNGQLVLSERIPQNVILALQEAE